MKHREANVDRQAGEPSVPEVPSRTRRGHARRVAWILGGLGVAAVAAASLAFFVPGSIPRTGGIAEPLDCVAGEPSGTAGRPSCSADRDRTIAMGFLMDSPRPTVTIDKGLAVAEKLRQHYGIDTGNVHADRLEAARRAQDYLDELTFTEADVADVAGSLGYSLDPVRCANRCDNIRRLAVAELKKRALERLADS